MKYLICELSKECNVKLCEHKIPHTELNLNCISANCNRKNKLVKCIPVKRNKIVHENIKKR